MDKRCKNCESWKSADFYYENNDQGGYCTSQCAKRSLCLTTLCNPTTLSSFGCIHWQECEPDLREQLAEHIFYLSHSWLTPRREYYECVTEGHRDELFKKADKTIAIFEKWQKGKENG